MTNKLGLVSVRVSKLKPGQSCLIGPFKQASSVTSKLLHLVKDKSRKFSQRRVILVDGDSAYKFFIVTRSE